MPWDTFVTDAKHPRKLGKFKVVASHSDRRNPQSLRRLLYEILDAEFNRDLTKAASSLAVSLGSEKMRKLGTEFTAEGLYSIVQDRTHIKYAHLEAFSRHFDMPTGVTLLISRVMANEAEGNHQSTLNMIRALELFIDFLIEKSNAQDYSFTIDDVRNTSNIFKLNSSGAEPYLNLEMPYKRARRRPKRPL